MARVALKNVKYSFTLFVCDTSWSACKNKFRSLSDVCYNWKIPVSVNEYNRRAGDTSPGVKDKTIPLTTSVNFNTQN